MTGKAGIVHLHVGDGARGLEPIREALHTELYPRVFNPTHVNRRKALFDDAIALARARLACRHHRVPGRRGRGRVVRRGRRWCAILDSGAPIERVSVSSDGGGCLPTFDADGRVCAHGRRRPGDLSRTLRALLAAGAPLERVLPAFTSNPARYSCSSPARAIFPSGPMRTSCRSMNREAWWPDGMA
jgi:beta-aspartyl-dipeptidase (metallo-type)